MPEGIPPAYWPASGSIRAEGLVARYSVDGPVVLKGIDLDIKSGERIGVVGRTGSGACSSSPSENPLTDHRLFARQANRLWLLLCFDLYPLRARSSSTTRTPARSTWTLFDPRSLSSLRTLLCQSHLETWPGSPR